MVQTYQHVQNANANPAPSFLSFTFPVDDTVASIHSFEARISDKHLVGAVVDKPVAGGAGVQDNELQFVPSVSQSKERDRFQV